ncbi:hypothetical protein VTJ83DRAFT_2405 [Remersonia thermophila]|uniref:Sm domain-containing protein n=1 Tax=Remersonia thermophila TaxID=72144 RepID=A0ABR4DIV6_9PEZI
MDTPARIKEESAAYLRALLNKNLRVTTTDNRMFWGTFRCTDYESNIVLQHTYEYRFPTVTSESLAAAAAAEGRRQEQQQQARQAGQEAATETDARPGPASAPDEKKTVRLDMTSRYLGLVVVPGKHIVKIEVEEFASQVRGRQPQQRRLLAKPPASTDAAGAGVGMGMGAVIG